MSTVQLTQSHSTPTRTRRIVSVVALALFLAPMLAGCLRVQVSMGVSANDRVSGQIVAANVPQSDTDKGPQLKPPDSLADKVRVQPYKQDGYVGTQAFFSDLTFGDVQQLGSMSGQSAGTFQIQLTREGDLVSLTGKADLKSVPAQGSDIQFTIAFPARVATTNGTRDGDSIVSWKLPPGETSTLRADVRYSDPNTRSFTGWAWIVGLVTLGIAAVIGALAFMNRNAGTGTAPSSMREALQKVTGRDSKDE